MCSHTLEKVMTSLYRLLYYTLLSQPELGTGKKTLAKSVVLEKAKFWKNNLTVVGRFIE